MRSAARGIAIALQVILASISGGAWAVSLPAFDLPEIGSVEVASTAKVGESVQITVKASKNGTSVCGVLVNFGDGSNQQIKVNEDNAKLPISVEHTYKKPGKYTVQVSGKKITTHHSCKGGASAIVSVSAPKKSGKTGKSKN